MTLMSYYMGNIGEHFNDSTGANKVATDSTKVYDIRMKQQIVMLITTCQLRLLPMKSNTQFVGNKAKRWILKENKENKARRIFRKTNIYPLVRTRTYQGVRNFRFSENLACFVFLNTRFKIQPFALLPANSKLLFYLSCRYLWCWLLDHRGMSWRRWLSY